MLAPSLSLAPLLAVTVARSDPARSIRDILACVTSALRPAVRARCSTNTWREEGNGGVASERCQDIIIAWELGGGGGGVAPEYRLTLYLLAIAMDGEHKIVMHDLVKGHQRVLYMATLFVIH